MAQLPRLADFPTILGNGREVQATVDGSKSRRKRTAKKVPDVQPEQVKSSAAVGLRDVARAAGVSTATVSRAINKPEVVSEELRLRISAVIDHLGWVPDAAARALSTRRSGAVGAVFPTLSHGDFARTANILQSELLMEGYTLLLACTEYDPEQELRQVKKFVERGVDGIVLVGNEHHPDLQKFLDRQQVPSINTFVYNKDTHGRSIGPDNRRALFDLTNYLISLGHRRFGVIWQSLANNDRAAERLAGVGDALAAHGLTAWPYQIAKELASISEARTLFRRIMNASPPPTAIICGNAFHAVGAELEALTMGLSIPGDVSIAGYDDIEIMSELPAPITTIRVPSDKIGRRAARYIISQIIGREEETQFECAPELILRASTGAPKA